MVDTEQTVTDLLVTLRSVDRILAAHTSELKQKPEWSSVTWELEPTQISEGPMSRIGFTGYVDGDRELVDGFAWSFDVLRDGRGWIVERSLSLNASTKNFHDVVAQLPTVVCADTRELSIQLPDLIRELLALPARRPASTG